MRRQTMVAALAVVLLVGCADDDAESGAATEAGSEPATEPAGDDDAGQGAVDPDEPVSDDGAGDVSGDGDATPMPARPEGEPLAATEHPAQELGGTLEIELYAREVGELLRVSVVFTPRDIGDERTSLAQLLGASASGDGISGRLIDPVNLLEYETVRAAVPHGQSAPAYQDQPTTLQFYFAAPEQPMETFDFLLDLVVDSPDWPGFVDVPYETS